MAIRYLLIIVTVSVTLFGADIPADFVMDTVRKPLADGIRLDLPIDMLGNRALAEMGYVDVCAAPFNADPTGKSDSTEAIQYAVQFACTNFMACFFPSGTYRISDTIECVAPMYRRQNGKTTGSARNAPNVLIGSAKGPRPVIMLAPSSPKFSDAANPAYVVYFWTRSTEGLDKEFKPSGNISMSQLFVGIDIVIGENNPGAVGIRHRAAQGSSIQDVRIDATHGLKGLEAGAGSGGSHHRVTIIGGDIGADLTEAQPAPTISGFTFINQRKHALVYSGMETLCLVGCSIDSSAAEPLILGKAATKSASEGLITAVDCVLTFKGESGTAFETERSLYLNNVYVKNASRIAATPADNVPGKSGWLHIKELALAVNTEAQGKKYVTAPIVDGTSQERIADISEGTPPDDIVRRHFWSDTPTWEHPNAVNIKKLGALGDGEADDTPVIEKAIAEHEIIFFPRGVYRITRTITLKPRTKLIGVSEQHSFIAAAVNTPFFSDTKNTKPLIATADTADADTHIAFIGTYAPSELTGVYDLLWRSGGTSLIRSYHAHHRPWNGYGYSGKPITADEYIGAYTVITGNGGGKWFNWYSEGHGMVWGKAEQDQRFRQVLISNNNGYLSLYQFNPEGSESAARVEIVGSKAVNIYGLKSEGNHPVLWAHDTDAVRIFGYGGNGTALSGSSMFRFENVENIIVANAMPRPAKAGQKLLGNSVTQDPSTWQLIIDVSGGKEGGTKPLSRPAVYRRGK